MTRMKHTRSDLSEGELLRMTRDLDQMHRDLFPKFRQVVAEVTDGWRAWAAHNRARNRRGGRMIFGAWGGSSFAMMPPGDSSGMPGAEPGDLAIARLSAAIEVLGVNTYQTVLDAASKGALGVVPPAIATFATTAKMQHADHLEAFNAALTAAGKPAQTDAEPHYKTIVDGALPDVKTVTDAAKLALTLETVAAETYIVGAAQVTDKANRRVLLAIAPVEAQHMAILNYVLGQEPVPDTFMKTDMAATVKE